MIGCGTRTTEASGDLVAERSRASSHPDFNRRSRNSTGSTGRWTRPGRGLSPPVRNFTDPGARCSAYQCAMSRKADVTLTTPYFNQALARWGHPGSGPSAVRWGRPAGTARRGVGVGRGRRRVDPAHPGSGSGRLLAPYVHTRTYTYGNLAVKRGDSVMTVSCLCHRIVTIQIARVR